MKRINILLLMSLLFITSCSKNDSGNLEESNKKWSEALSGMHLSHIESGSSLNADYTKSTQVYLCSNGSFYMSIVDSITGAEFYGIWQVEDKTTKSAAYLRLQFNDGDVVDYQLTLNNNGIIVDGTLFQYEYNQSQCN